MAGSGAVCTVGWGVVVGHVGAGSAGKAGGGGVGAGVSRLGQVGVGVGDVPGGFWLFWLSIGQMLLRVSV